MLVGDVDLQGWPFRRSRPYTNVYITALDRTARRQRRPVGLADQRRSARIRARVMGTIGMTTRVPRAMTSAMS